MTGHLGKGGMGEVWEAHYTRLSRQVAIKLLPGDLGEDVERQARFRREAQALSKPQHPNVCVLYDIGEEDDQFYLVLERLEGETLAERLEAIGESFALNKLHGQVLAGGRRAVFVVESLGAAIEFVKPSELGCSRAARSRASRLKRSSLSGSSASSSGKTLRATTRSTRESRACQTCPMPPLPSGSISS